MGLSRLRKQKQELKVPKDRKQQDQEVPPRVEREELRDESGEGRGVQSRPGHHVLAGPGEQETWRIERTGK